MEYEVKQIQPNHADHISGYNDKYLDKLFREETVIAQPKYDGERMLIHIDGDNVYCTSRRHSKKTDKFMENQDKLPILFEKLKGLNLGYTVLDCECYAKDWSTIVGILHSLPDRAIELQKQDSVKFAVFDCLWLDGKNIMDEPYAVRLHSANIVVNKINYSNMHIVKNLSMSGNLSFSTIYRVMSKDDAMTLMQIAIDKGFEGVVVKSLAKAYYDKAASLKCKKFETVDCVVCGYQQGNGKYSNTIGALEIGYYDPDTDKVIKISKVNCGTDEERNMWYKNWNKMINSVIEVKCQEVTDKSLRHPVYIRLRDDKDYKECLKHTIFKN